MKGEHLEHYLEDSPHRDVKLNEVFNKITDILQQTSVTPVKQRISCDVIENMLSDRNNIPISEGKNILFIVNLIFELVVFLFRF